jgi:ubiquinone/menaquinone biosynthesis C-methylase UbiE
MRSRVMKFIKHFFLILTGVCLSFGNNVYSTSLFIQQKKPPRRKIHKFPQLQVKLDDFKAEGLILDIGGGGEGVIGQLKENQVIAIDINKRELEEAPPGPLKIVMDARDLKFLDGSFNTATVFFTFMYISGQDHEKVFQELHRVLEPEGRLLIWDVIFPEKKDLQITHGLFPLRVNLPEKEIRTGYGVRWPEKGRNSVHFKELAEKAGFKVILLKDEENWFFMEVVKQR